MTRRALYTCLALYGGSLAFALACQTLDTYPGVVGMDPYDGGRQTGTQAGSGTMSAEGSVAVEEATEDDVTDSAVPSCPNGSTLFASNASNPQSITLDTKTAYWTNAEQTTDAGLTPSTGTVESLVRASSGGGGNLVVTGLTGPLDITNANGLIAFSVTGGAGSTMGTVGLYAESTSTTTTAGTMLQGPAGVALDDTNVYWVSSTGGGGVVVQSATVAGGPAIMLGIVPGNYSAGGLSVNGANLYFAAWLPSNEGGGIYTVPIGGGTPSPLQQFSSGEPSDVVTDSTSVYWSDIGTTGTAGVYSIPLGTGGGTITTLASDLGEPVHLAVDTANVYTGDFKSGAVLEIPISGSGAKTLVTSIRPNGVATDTGELVYFTTDTSICTVMK